MSLWVAINLDAPLPMDIWPLVIKRNIAIPRPYVSIPNRTKINEKRNFMRCVHSAHGCHRLSPKAFSDSAPATLHL